MGRYVKHLLHVEGKHRWDTINVFQLEQTVKVCSSVDHRSLVSYSNYGFPDALDNLFISWKSGSVRCFLKRKDPYNKKMTYIGLTIAHAVGYLRNFGLRYGELIGKDIVHLVQKTVEEQSGLRVDWERCHVKPPKERRHCCPVARLVASDNEDLLDRYTEDPKYMLPDQICEHDWARRPDSKWGDGTYCTKCGMHDPFADE